MRYMRDYYNGRPGEWRETQCDISPKSEHHDETRSFVSCSGGKYGIINVEPYVIRRGGGGDLQEFNEGLGERTRQMVGAVHSNSAIPPEHEALMRGKQHCCVEAHHRRPIYHLGCAALRVSIYRRSCLVSFTLCAAPSFSNISRARDASDLASPNLCCLLQTRACWNIASAKR